MNRRINHLHERALRLVYNDYEITFSELLKKDGSITIHYRNIHQVAIEMYKMQNRLSPVIMNTLFDKNCGPLTRSGRTFRRPNVNTVSKGEQSLRTFGAVIWDDILPSDYKLSKSLSEFKEKIKSWIPENCPCRLCKKYIPNLGFVEIFE